MTDKRPCPVCHTMTTLEMNDDGVWEYIPVDSLPSGQAVTVVGTNLVIDYGDEDAAHRAMDVLDDVLLQEGRHPDPALAVVPKAALQRLRDAIRYDSRIVGRGILEPLVDAIEVAPCPDPELHELVTIDGNTEWLSADVMRDETPER